MYWDGGPWGMGCGLWPVNEAETGCSEDISETKSAGEEAAHVHSGRKPNLFVPLHDIRVLRITSHHHHTFHRPQ